MTGGNSADESVHAGERANVNVNRFVLPRSPWELIVAATLALSIMVNVWAAWEIRDIGTRKWLHDYDLNQFQMGQFRELQREVDLDHALLERDCKR